MRVLLDGIASGLAAFATLLICGLPAWFTYQAILADVAPQWAFICIAFLAGIGLILTFAFLRKAFSGVAPSRERRRR